MRVLRQLVPRGLLIRLKDWRERSAVRSRHEQAWQRLKDCAGELSAACLADVVTRGAWEDRRGELRRQLQWMLGLDPLPPRMDLAAEVTGVLERPGYRIEKIVFQSQPGLFVTGNLYLPQPAEGPVPCVLYQCGHAAHPSGAKTQYQDRYRDYPAKGVACLALDPLGYGEVPGLHHGTHHLGRWDWLSAGFTPAGVEVWNAMRALDWLAMRPELDAARFGATGISGGGVMTLLLAALDERIQAAAPSCSTYTVGSQAAGELVGSQCDCTFYPNVFQLDYPVVAALVAPRPLLITSGKRDHIFPPAGYRELYRRARRIYELHPGGAERIRLVESNQGHADPPRFLAEAHGWMCRWLGGAGRTLPVRQTGAPREAEPTAKLVCLAARPARARNAGIDREFIPLPRARLPESGATWQRRRAELLRAVRSHVFGWFPAHPLMPRARGISGSRGGGASFFRASDWLVETEPGVRVKACLLEPKPRPVGPDMLVVVKRTSDWVVSPDDEVLPLLTTHAVLLVQPRFAELPLGGRDHALLERTAAMTGRTIAALQVWDVLRVIEWALREPRGSPGRLTVYGHGGAGVVALYAALLDERIGQVIWRDPSASHSQGPPMLAVRRFTDLPELAAALAPRRLTLLDVVPPAFEFTATVFRILGVEDHYRSGADLAEAVLAAGGPQAEDRAAATPTGSLSHEERHH